ncbi:MAG: hypothetical protein Q3985_00740 [Eubacteriales bacterium]|nr:hypothetical protein [Eubacteriales bacterium]
MKKARILAATLSMLLLTGCGAANTLADNHAARAAAAIAPMAAVIENPVDETEETVSIEEKTQSSVDASAAEQTETPSEKEKVEKPVAENKSEVKPEVKADTTSDAAKPEKVAVSKPVEQATPTAKTEPKAESEKKPVVEKKTDPEAPAFDIDYWVSYAKNYAKSIGLALDAGTSGTWDTPIHANSKTTDVLADYIRDDLNYYMDEEDCTAVWVWAEQIVNGQYELFISRG